MGFFNPALLWFALGGLIPIIIHLLHRQKFKRVRWAAMEFLLAALRKTRRRMQIENLLLLLLRILVVLLLALAVARPFFHEAPLGALEESDTHHVFVLDVSASMGYKRAQNTSLDVAKRAAEKVLQDLRPSEQDRFTLVTLSTYPEAVLKDRNRPQQLKDALAEMKPTDYGTSVYRTMQAVATVIREAKNRDKRVYLFTDLQAGGWVLRDEAETRKFQELLKELSQRPDTRFYLYDAGTSDAFNAAVVDLRVGDPVVTTRRKTRFSAVLHNFSSTPRTSANVHLHVNDSLVRTLPAVLPARASTEVTFEHDFTEAAPHFVKVSLDPDYLDADDHRYLALDVKTALRCLFIDGEPGDSPRSSEVFAPVLALDPSRQGLFFSVDVKTLPLFNAEGLDAYDFVALCNVQSLTSDKVEKLEQFVRRGGGLFVSLGDQVDKVSFNEHFWKGGKGLSPASLDEVAGTAPEGQLERGVERRIAKFHAGHPVFRQFQKRTMAALYGLVFYKYYKTKDLADPNAVLASLDDNFGSPFLLERTFEEGKVLLWTSTVDDEWNAGIQAYPPFFVLMWEMGLHLSARPGHQRNLFLGDLIRQTLPVELYQPPFLLETPQDGVVTLSAAAPAEDQKIFELYYPGRSKADDPKVLRNEGLRNVGKYRLTRSPAREEPKLVSYYAVNMPPRAASPEEIDAAEGNLERISREDIKVRYPDFKVEFRGEKKQGEAEMEVKAPASGLWKWLLYLVAGFMLAESVLACLFGRGKQ